MYPFELVMRSLISSSKISQAPALIASLAFFMENLKYCFSSSTLSFRPEASAYWKGFLPLTSCAKPVILHYNIAKFYSISLKAAICNQKKLHSEVKPSARNPALKAMETCSEEHT